MRAPPRDHDALDGRLAFAARFAFTAIYKMANLEESTFSIRTHIIRYRAPTQLDGFVQDFLQCFIETLQIISLSAKPRVFADVFPPAPATRPHRYSLHRSVVTGSIKRS